MTKPLAEMTDDRLLEEYRLRKNAYDKASKLLHGGGDSEVRVWFAASSIFGDVRDAVEERGLTEEARSMA